MGLRIRQAKELIASIVAYNIEMAMKGKHHREFICPILTSAPGVGKTSILDQVAQEAGIVYKDVIIAQYDPGELAGLPMYNDDKTRMIRLRPDYLPPAPTKDHSEGAGIFNLDELPQSLLAQLNIAAQMVNSWRIGEHLISQNWTIVATGNRAQDKAGTTAMPSHLKDRLLFIELDAHVDDWLEWASKSGVDPRVRAYIKQNQGRLNVFNPAQDASPTSRSWAKTGGILSMNLDRSVRREAVKGQIGEAETTNFLKWLAVEDKLPKIEDVIANPDTAPVFKTGTEISIAYLLLCSLADAADKNNIGQIIKYLDRYPNQELSVFCLHDMLKRDNDLQTTPEVRKWKMAVASGLLS